MVLNGHDAVLVLSSGGGVVVSLLLFEEVGGGVSSGGIVELFLLLPLLDPESLFLSSPAGVEVQMAVMTTLRAGIVKVVVALLDKVISPSLTVQLEKV